MYGDVLGVYSFVALGGGGGRDTPSPLPPSVLVSLHSLRLLVFLRRSLWLRACPGSRCGVYSMGMSVGLL